MATLTIKPTSVGNDIQIKSGDGNTTHATFGDTSTVTLGTATIANATIADATITAGTFPAGHIIQTTEVVSGTTDTSLNVGNSIWTDTVMTGSITTSGATNSVIIHCGFTFYIYNTSTDAGMATRFKKVHSGGTSYPDSCAVYDGSGNFHSAYYTDQAENYVDYYHFSMQDPACGVAGSITYTLQGGEYNAENIGIGNGAGMNGRWFIYFQEIQR